MESLFKEVATEIFLAPTKIDNVFKGVSSQEEMPPMILMTTLIVICDLIKQCHHKRLIHACGISHLMASPKNRQDRLPFFSITLIWTRRTFTTRFTLNRSWEKKSLTWSAETLLSVNLVSKAQVSWFPVELGTGKIWLAETVIFAELSRRENKGVAAAFQLRKLQQLPESCQDDNYSNSVPNVGFLTPHAFDFSPSIWLETIRCQWGQY